MKEEKKEQGRGGAVCVNNKEMKETVKEEAKDGGCKEFLGRKIEQSKAREEDGKI